MLCTLGFHTDRTIGRSAIKFKDIKALALDTPTAIVDNGNISQVVQLLGLNKKNIPAVELYVVDSYEEKRAPSQVARFFAFDETEAKPHVRTRAAAAKMVAKEEGDVRLREILSQ